MRGKKIESMPEVKPSFCKIGSCMLGLAALGGLFAAVQELGLLDAQPLA